MTTLAITLKLDMADLRHATRDPYPPGVYRQTSQIVAQATIVPTDPDLLRAVDDVVSATDALDEVLHTINEPLAIQRLYFAAKRLARIART